MKTLFIDVVQRNFHLSKKNFVSIWFLQINKSNKNMNNSGVDGPVKTLCENKYFMWMWLTA